MAKIFSRNGKISQNVKISRKYFPEMRKFSENNEFKAAKN